MNFIGSAGGIGKSWSDRILGVKNVGNYLTNAFLKQSKSISCPLWQFYVGFTHFFPIFDTVIKFSLQEKTWNFSQLFSQFSQSFHENKHYLAKIYWILMNFTLFQDLFFGFIAKLHKFSRSRPLSFFFFLKIRLVDAVETLIAVCS